MKIAVLNIEGKTLREINLNSNIWDINPHQQAIYDTVIAQQAAKRQGSHKTKTRAEVSGGGRKPWKQKGTGRARQGSNRSPQWRGGGVVFGPTTEVNYLKKVNKKVKRLALKSVLSLKHTEKNLLVINDINFDKPQTKQMIKVLANLKINNKKVLLLTNEIIENVAKSLNNIPKITNIAKNTINVYDILNAEKLVITENVVKYIEEVYA